MHTTEPLRLLTALIESGVRNVNMLLNVSNIYEKSRDYRKSFGVLRAAYHRTEGAERYYIACALLR